MDSQNSKESTVNIPSLETLGELLPLTHQVAGQTRFLQTKDGRVVLKPCGKEDQREHRLYKRLFRTNHSFLNQNERDLIHFLPIYRGPVIYNQVPYITMENIATGIRYPSIIDLKIGLTFDPKTEINEKENLNNPYLADVGFQLCGMKIFEKSDITYYYYDKMFGHSLNVSEIAHAIALFFQSHQILQTNKIIQTLCVLEQMQRWFQSQTTYHFYASSVILAYDAISDPTVNSVRVKLVDFAHLSPAKDSACDENFLYGLNSLIDCLKMIISSEYSFVDIRNKIF